MTVDEPSNNDFSIENHPIDDVAPIKVAVIGAGIAGITSGILLPRKVRNIELKIYEKNADVGGTWYENRYPGVRCDVPGHCYQLSFFPNTQWSEFYAQGEEIEQYWLRVAKHYDIYKYLVPSTETVKLEFDESRGIWTITLKKVLTGEIYTEEAHVVLTATGHFNAWKLPNYPGLEEYEGHLRHSSNWDPNFDPTGKTIAVIGNGASGIQIVPQLQKVAKHLDHYARSPTWIGVSFGGEELPEDPFFSKEVLDEFKDPEKYYKFRKELENGLSKKFSGIIKGSEANVKAKEVYAKLMAKRLGDKADEILPHILPEFDPGCRRLTPGPGYLEALTKDNVTFIPSKIERFTKNGIQTIDGKVREVDAIICSTGADTSFSFQFPIISGGKDLSQSWRPGTKPGFPDTYLGIAVSGFPNLLLLNGPNSAGHGGTVLRSLETQLSYIAKVLRKLQDQGIKSIVPSYEATKDFRDYSQRFFETTVLLEGCSSWYNGGVRYGRIHGLWPGSNAHSSRARLDPRWEDFDYTYKSKSSNRFAYFGNGWTTKDADEDSDLTPYLHVEGTVDLATIHEQWNSVA